MTESLCKNLTMTCRTYGIGLLAMADTIKEQGINAPVMETAHVQEMADRVVKLIQKQWETNNE